MTIRDNGAPRFPLSWNNNNVVIIRYNFDYLTANEIEMVQILDEFNVMEFRTMITLDQWDNKTKDNKLSKFP